MVKANDIKKVLKEKYDAEFVDESYWGLNGEIRRIKIEIEFCDDGFTLAVPLGEEKLLDELTGLFNELVGDGPICRYNLVDSKGELLDITVEWNALTPDARMRNILNGRGFNHGYKAVNLVEYYLSDDRKLELAEGNRFSPILFKGYHITDERLHEHFKTCPEADLVLIIKTFANFWDMYYSRKWAGSLPDPTDFPDAIDKAWRAVEERFLKPELEESLANQENVWSKWWSEYFDLDTHLAYMQKRKEGIDAPEFRPEGSWEDLLIKQDNELAPGQFER